MKTVCNIVPCEKCAVIAMKKPPYQREELQLVPDGKKFLLAVFRVMNDGTKEQQSGGFRLSKAEAQRLYDALGEILNK